jgi:two-component system, chemotaxis family, sensor kinase Cph1
MGVSSYEIHTPGSEGGTSGMTPVRVAAHRSAALNGESTVNQNGIDALHARIAQLERERDAAEGFAALAAHELMAPLVLTEACVSLAGERLSPEEAPDLLQALDVLGRGASRTRYLVEALLHEARASSRPLRPVPVDLAKLTRDCLDLLAPEVESRDANIVLGDMPVVAGEPELLAGLMTNLLVNALKFSPRLGGVVTIGSERLADGWAFFVESEGPPIAAYDRERIFEPYHRGRGERRARGAGLGLTICRRIAERHGGTIRLADTSGEDGNRFVVTLPA